jgi:hypothetical protein
MNNDDDDISFNDNFDPYDLLIENTDNISVIIQAHNQLANDHELLKKKCKRMELEISLIKRQLQSS